MAGDPQAVVVKSPEIALADGIPVPGRREIPFKGLAHVLWDALAMLIERSQIVFGGRVALERRGTVFLFCLGIIAGDAFAMLVQIAEEGFRVGIILGGGRTEPLEVGLVVVVGRRGGRAI